MNHSFEPDPAKKFDIVGAGKERYPNIGELVIPTSYYITRIAEPIGPGMVISYDYDYEYGVPMFLIQWPDFLLWEENASIQKLSF